MIRTIEIQLPHHERGYHLVTAEIFNRLPQLPEVGLLHLFIKHTSAALTINENADPDVRRDFASFFSTGLFPTEHRISVMSTKGDDDMSAHIKGIASGCFTDHSHQGRASQPGYLARYLSV